MSAALRAAGPVTMIGAGRMGTALARGWLKGGLPGSDLTLVDPAPGAEARALAEGQGAQLRAEVSQRLSGVVVLAVKPQAMGNVLAALKPQLSPEALVVSIAAGIGLGTLSRQLGTERIVRTMPNTPAQLGKGVTGAVAGAGIGDADRARVEALLEAAGTVVWLRDEGLIDAVTAVSGSGPAYVFHLVEALAAAGVEAGLEDGQAMALARQTVIGAAALLEADPAPAAALRANVTSPGGTTQAALAVLMGADGLTPLMTRAVAAAKARSAELGA